MEVTGLYGKKYLAAETVDDLMLALGEACCLAAFGIVKIFDLPRRGTLQLKITKAFSRRSWEHFHYLYNATFSHCLVYVIKRLEAYWLGTAMRPTGSEVAGKAGGFALSHFGFLSGYSQEENTALLREMESRLLRDYPAGGPIDEKTLLQNIRRDIGERFRPQHAAAFFHETVANDPLCVVEPFCFSERYLTLRD